jgi:hypothetical protein
MISSPQAELQGLLWASLTADAGVMALADAVHDTVPPKPFAGPQKAYVSFGPSDVTDDGAECIIAGVHTLQLDCWSRQIGSVHCKRLTDAVCAALDEKPLELADNALAEIRVVLRQVMRDPDGLTTHGIIQVEAQIEEPE